MPIDDEAVAKVRRMTGVGSAEYTLDGDTFWTDDQIQALLDLYTVEEATDYDSVAADILEGWSAYLSARTYDVSMDGQSLSRSQIIDRLNERAHYYRDGSTASDTPTTVAYEAPL